MTLFRFQLPAATVHRLEASPSDRPVVALIRHSVREPLPSDGVGLELPITPEGEQLARELGRRLAGRVKQVRSSPFLRCLQTGEQLIAGSGAEGVEVVPDRSLGQPSLFVENTEVAWSHWRALGNEEMMRRMVDEDAPLPGMADPVAAAHRMVDYLFESAEGVPGIHLFVSHDTFVLTTAAKLFRRRFPKEEWPPFLEALVMWKEGEKTRLFYRSEEATLF